MGQMGRGSRNVTLCQLWFARSCRDINTTRLQRTLTRLSVRLLFCLQSDDVAQDLRCFFLRRYMPYRSSVVAGRTMPLFKWTQWKRLLQTQKGQEVCDYLRQGRYVFVVVCLSVYLSVCLTVSNFAQKTSERICMKFSGKIGNGPMNKRLNFGGDPDRGSGYRYGSGSISRHWYKTCLGGGMHCPSASSLKMAQS